MSKTKVAVGIMTYVLIAVLVPWAALFAIASESGIWPESLVLISTAIASAIAGLNALKAYTSGSFSELNKQ